MDKLTSLPLSPDRVLIQLVIPGGLGALPFIMLACEWSPAFRALLSMDSHFLMVAVCTVLSLVVGILLENLGSRFEVDYIDVRLAKEESEKGLKPTFNEIWDRFLQLSYVNEPVGQRYLRNILVRLKFELSTGFALIGHSIGFLFYGESCYIFGCRCIETIYHLGCWGIALYLLFFEAVTTAQVLARTRRLLVERYDTGLNGNISNQKSSTGDAPSSSAPQS